MSAAWVKAFLSGKATEPDDSAAFAKALRQSLEQAAGSLSPLELARALGQRAPAAEAAAALSALHIADVALTLRVISGERGALETFERVLIEQVKAAVSRVDASPAFADEVAQLLRVRLLLAEPPAPARLLEYSGRGPLTKWLRVSALRTGLSLRRGVQARPASDEVLADMAAPGEEPELELLRGRYRTQFREAFTQAFGALSAHERNLLRLHYLEGVSLVQVGQHYGLHRVTVARQLDQARQILFDETRRLVAEQLQLGREEFEALVAVLRSQLDISIRRFLKESAK